MQPQQTSIVLELQQLASDSQAPLADVLRKALIVATKLKLEDFKTWVQDELSGYDKPVPEYRIVRGQMSAFNPYRGTIPLVFNNDEIELLCSSTPIASNVAEIEQLAQSQQLLSAVIPGESVKMLHRYFNNNQFMPQLSISPASMRGILDKVRSVVLEWALRLEQEGILGAGMTFSEHERKKAAEAPNIHIGSIGQFTGNVGSIAAHNLQVGNFSSINEQLKDAGIPQAERNQLENILDELPTAKGEQRRSLMQRGLDWLGRNAANLGEIGGALRKVFSATP